MPRGRAYQFLATPGDQNPTTREFQRTVRSHAASVSRPDRITRRKTRRPSRNQGEGVIVFDANSVDTDAERGSGLFPESVGTGEPTTVSRHSQPPRRTQAARHNQSNYGYQPLNANTPGSPYRLRTNYLSGDTFSPVQHLSTYHNPYLPGIVNHYIFNLTIPIPELDGNSDVPLFRAAWLPIVFHDPVVFQVVVLFAATHYATFAHPSQYHHLYLELLTLKQSALLALIQTVQGEQAPPPISTNQARDSRDTLIAAAAKMASYEAIFGTSEAFHLHMSTVTRLLRLQGGPATLGMGGFLARLLSFIDTNSAFLLGTNLYLVEFGLSGPMPQARAVLPRWFGEVAPQSHGYISSTNVVNLERFIGFMNVSGQDNDRP